METYRIFCKVTATSLNEANEAFELEYSKERELYNSSLLTSFAFKEGLSFLFSYGDKIVTVSVLLFALSTAIAWSFYGNELQYIFLAKRLFSIYGSMYSLLL